MGHLGSRYIVFILNHAFIHKYNTIYIDASYLLNGIVVTESAPFFEAARK